jgi:hypothetical protein
MKQITAQQHANLVMKSHFINGTFDPAYCVFAKPSETQAEAIKRFMAKLKRDKRKPEQRLFPKTAQTLTNTRAYVEAYYALNQGALRGAYADATVSNADYVRSLFGELSTAPTTWPETDEVTVEIED